MTEKYFAEYTRIKVEQFRETLLQHMGNVKKFVAKRTHHKRQYDIRVNKRQMQTHASKVDSSKALDVDLVVMESNGTESGKQDTSSSSGNYLTHVVDHTEQSDPIYDTYLLEKIDRYTTPDSKNMSHRRGEIDQDAEQYQVKSPLLHAKRFKTFSPNKSSAVHEKPNTPRSCLRWKPTGRIFKTDGLRWVLTGNIFTDSTTKVGSKPSNGSNDDITNLYECDQTLNVSASTLNLSAGLVQNIPSPTPAVPPTKNDWDSFFQPMFDEYFKPPPNVDHPVPEVPTPVHVASISSPSSTTVDQDTPSTTTTQTTSEQQSSVILQGVEDNFYDIKVTHMDNDPYFGILIPKASSEETTLQGVIP
nr:hypothetical protein [Tanacetum cinerariifolium]